MGFGHRAASPTGGSAGAAVASRLLQFLLEVPQSSPKHPNTRLHPPALGRKGAELSFHQIPAPPHVKATILISFQQAVEGRSESTKTTQIPRPGEGRPEEEAGVMPLIRPSDAAGKNGQAGRCRSSKEGLCGLFFFQLL